jgi:hypothetical protein
VVCDESSILKNFDGTRKAIVTEFLRLRPYRLLCTATAAPNDYIELGTTSEALGEMGFMDMLNKFFKNDNNTSDLRKSSHHGGGVARWRFKKHAQQPFWRWVCSWARAIRKPSDMGFDDGLFQLPPLIEKQTVIENSRPFPGEMFVRPAVGLKEQREEARATLTQRCEKVADLVSHHHDCSLIWCHLNDEGDSLEQMIPGSVQISGSDSDDWKEMVIQWFCGEKCICNHSKYRHQMEILCGNSNIRRTENGGNGKTKNMLNDSEVKDQEHQRKTKCTCESTIKPINTNGRNERQKNNKNIMRIEDGNMLLMRNTGIDSGNNLGSPQTREETTDYAVNTTLQTKIMQACCQARAEDAPSVDHLFQIGRTENYTSITATQPDSCADYSAQIAILESENSRTIQNSSKKQQCICGHKSGKRVLISKQKIFGYGLNLQHCCHIVVFPSHSFEAYYQGVRRCWRFGQTEPVTVDVVTTKGGLSVLKNLQRKSEAASVMFDELLTYMNEALKVDTSRKFTTKTRTPQWL